MLGTMKAVQKTATQSLNIFAERDSFTRGPPDLRLEVLHFLTKLSSDRVSTAYGFVNSFNETNIPSACSLAIGRLGKYLVAVG
jgi:hypothetical protein